ncbi:MAG: hypothetical protein QM743_09370 [Chitinophagaceae bacterium]
MNCYESFREEAGKEKAFSELIRRYQERLYWHIRRMVIHHEARTIYCRMFL